MFGIKNINGNIITEERQLDAQQIQNLAYSIKNTVVKNVENEEKTVAIALPRNEYLIATIWALFDCRITFLLLDLDYPEERINEMLTLAKIETIITMQDVERAYDGRRKVFLDYLEEVTSNTQKSKKDNEIAYLMFTSGTTGIPKAVMVTYKGMNNFLKAIPKKVPIQENTRIGCFTNVMFDIFFLEGILPLLYQGTVVLAGYNECNNPKSIIRLISERSINTLQLTPSRFRMLSYADKELSFLSHISVIMLGGEQVPYSLVEEIQKRGTVEIYNMYGPTETTIWSTVSNLTNKKEVDIGQPIQNTYIYILDENHRKVRVNEIGEICITGSGLAQGYLYNKEQTEKVFLNGTDEIAERLYCTGDMGYVDEIGNFFCLGRKDNQIKIRGHRVELEDIEAGFRRKADIDDISVCWDSDNEQLIAFYISMKFINEQELRKSMIDKIPDYMIPNEFIKVESFLYTKSGKLDRNLMLKKRIELEIRESYLDAEHDCMHTDMCFQEKDEILESVIDILSEVAKLDRENIFEDSNLPNLGIDSITFVHMVVELEDMYDIEFDDEKMVISAFENVKGISDYVKEKCNCF